MKSIFANLELDTIRYSLVWEDWQTLYNNLEVQSGDNIAIVTSAGCNVLNALLKQPASVTAIDLNPVQNNLLQLKLHVIEHHDYNTWRGIMGFAGKEAVANAWEQISKTLTQHKIDYWQNIIADSSGLIALGKLEKYINGYFITLPENLQQKIRKLFDFSNVTLQYNYYREYLLNNKTFVESFTTYFADENLSRGRDPKLFTHAEQKGGTTFFARLEHFLTTHLAADNFYLRFFFLGAENIPVDILPPCHRPEYFNLLKQQAHTVKVINGEAVDHLLSAGMHINKASLSNIFEYISHADFKEVMELLFAKERKLKLIYWNLLQNQVPCHQQKNIHSFTAANEQASCFYFNNATIAQQTDSVH